MKRPYLYGLLGHEPFAFHDVIEWARAWELLHDRGLSIVAQETVGATLVSTVFLGIDYSHGFGADPLLFETMTFPDSTVIARYTTWDQAAAGHAAIVKRLTEALTVPTN